MVCSGAKNAPPMAHVTIGIFVGDFGNDAMLLISATQCGWASMSIAVLFYKKANVLMAFNTLRPPRIKKAKEAFEA